MRDDSNTLMVKTCWIQVVMGVQEGGGFYSSKFNVMASCHELGFQYHMFCLKQIVKCWLTTSIMQLTIYQGLIHWLIILDTYSIWMPQRICNFVAISGNELILLVYKKIIIEVHVHIATRQNHKLVQKSIYISF